MNNNTTKQNETKAIQQVESVKELHEAELESVSGAQKDPHPCFHWVNSSSSCGF